ncbi:MAG TPA: hypothetical protein HPP80_05105 [Rhodospirillaceae bacterium]|nr:hypothetical protein [Rhodospirillaceae bacterium]
MTLVQAVSVFFGRLANGQRQWTDWIGAGDGFVVLDKSGKTSLSPVRPVKTKRQPLHCLAA